MPMQPTLSTGGRLLTKVYPDEKYDITEYPKDNTPHIIKVLRLHSKSKQPVLEILCKDSGYFYDKKMNLIFDRAGRVNSMGEYLEKEFGIRRNAVKCTQCNESIQTDVILYHLQNSYQNGHKLPINKVIEFLETITV